MTSPKADTPLYLSRDLLVCCRNSQGIEVRATPARITRYNLVFEVYNPYSILQMSEVLSDFRITIGERLVYAGRAVVNNLVNTGIMVLCEATLDEAWLDVDLFSPISQRDRLKSELDSFLQECRKIAWVDPQFKVVVADMQTLLTDLRRWLEQLELGIRSIPTGDRSAFEREVVEELRPSLLSAVDGLFAEFETIACRLSTDNQSMHRSYMRRQLHPLILCAPFAYRTYRKPLGYAGDYEMVNMILRDPLEGSSLFAKMVNLWFLNQAPAKAHRNRIDYLTGALKERTAELAAQGRRNRIMNLGCGPAQEIQRFMTESDVSNHADFLLLDFNDETLAFTGERLENLRQLYHRTTGLQYAKRSVHQLLKDSVRVDPAAPKYDTIYCAGLFDYLSDRICQRLINLFYEQLAPGGLVIATNVDPSNPLRNGMEFLLEWHLIYRDPAQMKLLHPTGTSAQDIVSKSDETGVNIYLEVRKPGV